MDTSPDSRAAATPRVDSGDVYAALRRRIIHLDLPPGARLREEALAKEFGVSRTPIRRVLDRLAHEGLVTISPGSGASVSLVDFQALREVWALRLKISELVGDFVRLPASDVVISRLEGLLERLAGIDDAGRLADLYDEYHEAMVAVMANGPLRSIFDQLYAQTARVFVQMLPSLSLEAEIGAIRDEIELTLEACRGSDGHRLAAIRTRHMRQLLGRVSDSLSITPPE